MANETNFTVVVPTRDRSDTLLYCLQTVLSQNYKNYEILVSDNASTDRTEQVVKNLSDSRIKYVNTGRRVSMSNNWEFALSHVQEGWVTVLGDDDALVPGALGRVNEIIFRTGAEAIRSNGASYLWPSLSEDKFGKLHFSRRNDYTVVNSRNALLDVLNGKRAYNTLPMLYNGGFIDGRLINKAKSVSGDFFHSMTPDVYSAMVFAMITATYVYSYQALAINGASHHSGGTAAFEKKTRQRDYDPANKFFEEGNISLHKDVPATDSGKPVKSLHACILEAYLQAARHFDPAMNVPSYEDHLRTILREAHRDEKELTEWGKKFSTMHSLDFEKIVKSSQRDTSRYKLFSNELYKMLSGRSVSFYGSNNVPLSNVYEASCVIGFSKDIGLPTRAILKSVLSRVARKLHGRTA